MRYDRTLPWISNIDLILINPVRFSNPLIFLYKCMQMCHFWNRTTSPSNACNFGYEVSNCEELLNASMGIKHLLCEWCHILQLCPLCKCKDTFFAYCMSNVLLKLRLPDRIIYRIISCIAYGNCRFLSRYWKLAKACRFHRMPRHRRIIPSSSVQTNNIWANQQFSNAQCVFLFFLSLLMHNVKHLLGGELNSAEVCMNIHAI